MRRTIVLLAAASLAACASTNETQAVSSMKEAREAVSTGDFDRADASARHALDLRPGFIDAMMLLAAIAEERHDWEEARRRYREVLTNDPTDTSAGVAIGVTYVKTGQFDEGRDWFLKAIDSDPGYEAAAYNLGSVYEQLNDLDAAVAWFDISSTLDRRDPRALTRIAAIRLGQNRPKDALDAADAALRRWPQSQSAQALRARALEALGGRK